MSARSMRTRGPHVRASARLATSLAAAICLVSLARASFAQDGSADPDGVPVPSALPADVRSLDHDDALRIAATRNLALLSRSLEPKRAEQAASAARRPYTPELGMEGAIREVPGQIRRALQWIPSITYAAPFGTAVRAEGSFSEGISGNPESQRTMFVEISQAVLRRGPATGGAELDLADLEVRIAKEEYRAALNDLLAQADRAYWDLVFTREDLVLKQRSLDRARTQFEETSENIRRGLLAPGEIFLVEESVVNFEERLSRAQEALQLAENAMRRLLVVAPQLPLGATIGPPPEAAADPAEAESQSLAASRHPRIMAARLSTDQARAGVDVDKNVALPQLDAFGSLGVASGNDALRIPLDDSPELRAGVRLAIPLYWGPDVARVARAKTEVQQRMLELRDIEVQVAADVRDAGTRLRGRRKRVELAAKVMELAQKKLDNEKEKYKSGLSTLVDVVRFQRELDEAMSSALRAKVELLTARTAVLAARGDLHESLRIVIR
jgi:outer membrane protein TolC